MYGKKNKKWKMLVHKKKERKNKIKKKSYTCYLRSDFKENNFYDFSWQWDFWWALSFDLGLVKEIKRWHLKYSIPELLFVCVSHILASTDFTFFLFFNFILQNLKIIIKNYNIIFRLSRVVFPTFKNFIKYR